MKRCSCGLHASKASCPYSGGGGLLSTSLLGSWFGLDLAEPQMGPPRPKLADEVERQVAILTADLDFVGGEELPRPPADPSSYADAYAAALAACTHPNTTNLLYQREWQCDDCGRYLDKAAYKKSSGGMGWMFGG